MILRLFAAAIVVLSAGAATARTVDQPSLIPPPVAAPEPSPPPTVAPPAPVAVQSLAVLDLFSPGGAGLGPDLWKGSSGAIARSVIPTLGAKPLTPAFAALARRALATGASGPEDAGADRDLAAARVAALLALGDAQGASEILDQTDVAASAGLSRAAAEAALILGDDDKACRVAEGLTSGRDGLYWLRLRAYCQARAGEGAAAQLTIDLAEAPSKDPVWRRLISVVVAGGGSPGPASARDGLELALSRRLALDLAPAMAAAPLAVRRRLAPVADPVLDAPALEAAAQRGLGDGAAPADLAAAALYVALGNPISPAGRARLAAADLGRGAQGAGRLLALRQAAMAGAKGDVVLLSLAMASDAGAKGPSLPDRVAAIAALQAVGLTDDARAIAAEGLAPARVP